MQGAFETGVYPNRFAAFGHGKRRSASGWTKCSNRCSYGPEDVRLYHPAGEDMGYLEDTGNHDVRTEGMSYGMMFCVQLDRRAEFDRLWCWALTHMYMTKGRNAGYFAWSCRPDGQEERLGPRARRRRILCHGAVFCRAPLGQHRRPLRVPGRAERLLPAESRRLGAALRRRRAQGLGCTGRRCDRPAERGQKTATANTRSSCPKRPAPGWNMTRWAAPGAWLRPRCTPS